VASPNTLAMRAKMATLTPTVLPVQVERTPKTMLRGEYAELLAQSITRTNRQDRERQTGARARNDTARGLARTTPASGPGRRRAKALRNARAVAHEDATA